MFAENPAIFFFLLGMTFLLYGTILEDTLLRNLSIFPLLLGILLQFFYLRKRGKW